METKDTQRARSGNWRPVIGLLAVMLAALELPFSALAASVLETSLSDMLGASELVFEGRVARAEPRMDSNNRVVRTYVTFDVLDVIKGDYAAGTVEISFLGGTVDDMTVKIADMALPETGAKGIFFVESLSRPQVNPLYGWSQGHIVIARDSLGVLRVTTAGGQPILGVDTQKQPALSSLVLSTGVARGLRTGPAERLSEAMTVEAFKHTLKDLLASEGAL